MDAQDHGTVPGLAAPELAHHHPVDLASLGTAAAPAVVTPRSDNAHLAVGGVEGQKGKHHLTFEQPTDEGKRFATLRAHLALKGYSLQRTEAGDGPVCFYVTRWGMARELRDLPAVARFLDQVGGAYA
jgi:hypothetical protein